MINQGRGKPTYLQSQNPEIRLWHKCLRYMNNARIIHISRLVDGIKIDDLSNKVQKNQYSSSDIERKEDEATFIHKAININVDVELCNICVENKHMKIVKSKK